MYCYKCGKENNNGDVICDECKAKLNGQVVEATAEPEETLPAAEVVEEKVEEPVESALVAEYEAAMNGGTVEPTPAPEVVPAQSVREEYAEFMGRSETGANSDGQNQPAPKSPKQVAEEKKRGFGKALASTILSGVAYGIISIVSAVAELMCEEIVEGELVLEGTSLVSFALGMMVFCLIVGAAAIVGIVFGSMSIGVWKKAKRNGDVKPVATFTLGLIGLILSCLVVLDVITTGGDLVMIMIFGVGMM